MTKAVLGVGAVLAVAMALGGCAAETEEVGGSESAVTDGRTVQSAAWVYQPSELAGASEALLTDDNLSQAVAIAARTSVANADDLRAGRDPLREATGALYPLARAYRAAMADVLKSPAAGDPRCSLASAAEREGRTDRVATAAVVCRR